MPPPTCFLHVGGYKTGTTYLQRRLADGRTVLREHGVLVPGAGGAGMHANAARVILGRDDVKGRPVPASIWYDLRDEMLAYDGGSAVFSSEELSSASTQQAARMVADLTPADVRVVLTTRDLVRVIPAAWQELMKGGKEWTWSQYVDTISSRVGRVVPPGRTFWRLYDWAALAERWAEVVGPGKIIVVTVPPVGSSPELLWHRYCAAVGADPTLLPPDLDLKNESLDATSAELLRRFNLRAADALPADVYVREVRRFLGNHVLANRTALESVRLDGSRNAWARAEGERIASGLASLGVRVEGDLTDLVGTGDDRPADPPPTADDLLEAAIHAMTALVGRLGERTARDADRASRRYRKGKSSVPPADAEVVPLAVTAPSRPPPTVRARRLAGRLLRDAYDRTRR